MRIAFLSGLYPPNSKGGGEISTHLIARGLVALGHEVVVFVEGESEEEVLFEGLVVRRMPIGLTTKPLFERWQARRSAYFLTDKLEGFDVVHAHDFRSTLVLAEMNISNRVATVRDYAQISGDTNFMLRTGELAKGLPSDAWLSQRVSESSFPRNMFRWWQYFYNTAYRKKSFKKIKRQIYISNSQLELVSKYQDLSGVDSKVIYNPVSADYTEGKRVRGTQSEVLYVGRVEKYKGVGLLLDAWGQISKNFPQAKLRIVGDGAQRLEYEEMVDREGLRYSVEFVGHIPWSRLKATYDESSVVVAPHLWVEPFGRTVVEAMARGKVVLAADHGGAKELIKDGETGFLFNYGSIEDLRDKLSALIEMDADKADRVGDSAKEWVKSELSTNKIAEEYESYYLNQIVA